MAQTEETECRWISEASAAAALPAVLLLFPPPSSPDPVNRISSSPSAGRQMTKKPGDSIKPRPLRARRPAGLGFDSKHRDELELLSSERLNVCRAARLSCDSPFRSSFFQLNTTGLFSWLIYSLFVLIKDLSQTCCLCWSCFHVLKHIFVKRLESADLPRGTSVAPSSEFLFCRVLEIL